jgi:formylglycine-generating enzyme required for sulfatase activity
LSETTLSTTVNLWRKIRDTNELLLILDDLDYLIGDEASSGALEQWITSLLVNSRSRILITARGMLPFGVFNRPMEVLGLEAIAARQVFEKYVPDWGQARMARPAREAFQAVMELLDGYSLAIAIAAKYMERQGCDMQDLQERLSAEFPQVMGRSRNKNDSLMASLNLSYDVLPPAARDMFAHLALFPGGLTVEVAQAIFGRGSRDALETLTIYSMAERTKARVWRLPEPARKYAEDKQIPGAMARYAPDALRYFHDFCQQLVEQLADGQTSQSAVESWIFGQQANLRHFLDWGNQQEQGDRGVCYSARVTALLAPFWSSVQPGGDPIARIDLATVAAQRCYDSLAVADLQKAKGDQQLVKQGLAVARASYDRAIELYGSIQATGQIEQAQIQQKLGAVWDIYSDSPQAESCYVKAFELYEAAGDRPQAARMKMAISDVQREADRQQVAVASYQAALEIYESLADRSGMQRAEGRIRKLRQETVELETSEPFAVVTVNEKGEEIDRQMRTAQFFRETLPGDVELEMISIPAGEFLMGSPAWEDEDTEKPQHLVKVSDFFMGKYPITQMQWRAIALQTDLKVARELDPEPAYFPGDDRPVECVSWEDVMEFCGRLSQLTHRAYGLPSEAQWEYACRAGTTTPFHSGPTISSHLANYDGKYSYGQETRGEYRGQTTAVGSFKVVNSFGLYDMHGNVWEWCADSWHENYQNAPKDGSDWVDSCNIKVLRGGSWFNLPRFCRSACRYDDLMDGRYSDGGFRVFFSTSGFWLRLV